MAIENSPNRTDTITFNNSSSLQRPHSSNHSPSAQRRIPRRNDRSSEHSKILPLTAHSHGLILPRRQPLPHSLPPILVSRSHLLLFTVIMCFIRCHCKYLVENCWEANSLSVDCCDGFSVYHKSFNWMEFRDSGRRNSGQTSTRCIHQ